MKVILTNKENPEIKVEYDYKKIRNISVQSFVNPENGFDGSPVWFLELAHEWDTASFKCAEWNIEVI